MCRSVSGLALVASLLIAAGSAYAAEGWFAASGEGPLAFQSEEDLYADTERNPFERRTASFNTDASWERSVGYALGDVRFEGQAFYREDEFENVEIEDNYGPTFGTVPGNRYDASGKVAALGVMANAWYRYESEAGWTPYIGGGVGAAMMSVSETADYGENVNLPVMDTKDWVIAYQVGAGFRYAWASGTSVHVGYRYFATADRSFSGVDGVGFDTGYNSHNFMVEFAIPLR